MRMAIVAKRMDETSPVQMLVPRIFGMDGDGRVSEHRLQTRGRNYHLLVVHALHLVRKRNDHTKLVLFLSIVTGNFIFQCFPLQIDVIHFNVRDGRVQL